MSDELGDFDAGRRFSAEFGGGRMRSVEFGRVRWSSVATSSAPTTRHILSLKNKDSYIKSALSSLFFC